VIGDRNRSLVSRHTALLSVLHEAKVRDNRKWPETSPSTATPGRGPVSTMNGRFALDSGRLMSSMCNYK